MWADGRNALTTVTTAPETDYQLFFAKAQAGYIWDVDGNCYVDAASSFGVNFLGHNHPVLMNGMAQQQAKSCALGMQNELAGEVAKLICEFTGNDRCAFLNSGTEAVMMAIRLGRVATKKNLLVTFTNCYHGWSDAVMVHRQGTSTVPVSAGICADQTVQLEHDSLESLEWIKNNADRIGVVLIEPMQSGRIDLKPRIFHKALRKITEENNIALVFDEVVTGFRLHQGGAQMYWGIRADIAVYGKALASGFPIGVVAGKAKFLNAIDGGYWEFGDDSLPRATVTFFAGTFCKHPLTMSAALCTLQYMKQQGKALQAHNNLKNKRMCDTLNDYLRSVGAPMRMLYGHSCFRFKINPAKAGLFDVFWIHLLNRGVYTWEARVCFLSVSHTAADVQHIINSVKDSIQAMMDSGYLQPTWEPDSNFIQERESLTPEMVGIVDDGFQDDVCTRHFEYNPALLADPFTFHPPPPFVQPTY